MVEYWEGIDPSLVGRRVSFAMVSGNGHGTAADYIALDAGLVHTFRRGSEIGQHLIPALTAAYALFKMAQSRMKRYGVGGKVASSPFRWLLTLGCYATTSQMENKAGIRLWRVRCRLQRPKFREVVVGEAFQASDNP